MAKPPAFFYLKECYSKTIVIYLHYKNFNFSCYDGKRGNDVGQE
jgi:hypothetical protein